jgi:histidinol-phosphate aminotransferase
MSQLNLLIRPSVRRLDPYVPGEQPKIKDLIKLNTNENPYPPSGKVLAAIRTAVDGRLRLYPNPTSQILRDRLAKLHKCEPENIIIGNGSDELLAMAVRAFVDPVPLAGSKRYKSMVQYFTPSYSLYPVLANMHGTVRNPVTLEPDFRMQNPRQLKRERMWDVNAALTFITTPNAPSGRGYSTQELESICSSQRGVVVLDEAYVDFAEENALSLALKIKHVLVARTFSKAYSLCFQRVGYMIGHPELIAALDKIRDSYNVNGLGQVAAIATLDDLPYYRANFAKIISSREKLSSDLIQLGFQVLPSQTNFIFARPQGEDAQRWHQGLRERKILVRWFNQPGIQHYLRITVGTPQECAALLKAVKEILA